MENRRLSTKAKLIISSVAIVGLLVFSGILANTVQNNSARRASATVSQNELNIMILAIRGDIAESMFPAHDYLIKPSPDEEKEFREYRDKIEKTFQKLWGAPHLESIDRRIIKEALGQFKKLERIQEEIFALRGKDIQKRGPAKMEHMHVYQHAILKKLRQLNDLEQAEFANLVLNEQTSSRRSILLIAAAATLALGGALLVGYLSSQT